MQDAPPILFLVLPKKRMRRARWKRKNVRRVGLRQRRPPAAGGGWLAVPCSSQGRKRPALGETSSPGKYRDTLSLPPRCRSRSREEQPAAATAQPLAALPLTDAACPLRASGTRGRRNQWNTGDGNTGSAAARDSKRGANQMRPCTPTRSEPPPRDGSIDLAEDPSVPEGQAKSEQAPIRRPPCARRATAPERA